MANSVRLSKRLLNALSYQDGNTLLDVGCDHALLAIAALQSGLVHHAIAIDNKPGPIRLAKENVHKTGYQDVIDCRLGDGLEPLDTAVDTAYILGMGGQSIASILRHPNHRLVKRFVLGPHSEVKELRQFLSLHQFKIIDEDCLKDKSKIYVQLVVIHGQTSYTEDECEFGPILIKKQLPVWKAMFNKTAEKYQKAIEATTNSIQRQSLQRWLDAWRRNNHECD